MENCAPVFAENEKVNHVGGSKESNRQSFTKVSLGYGCSNRIPKVHV